MMRSTLTSLTRRLRSRYELLLPKLPDRLNLSLRHYENIGFLPRWGAPQSYTEKIQWRKLFQHHPDMPRWIDKVSAKDLAADLLGPDWIIPTLFSGPTLPLDTVRSLEPPFIIKPSHSSGPVIAVTDTSAVDWPEVQRRCAEWTRATYGSPKVEWAYSRLTPGIIIERFIDKDGESPPDYKFYVFHGVVRFIHVDTGRQGSHRRTFFDRDWKRQDFTLKIPAASEDLQRPAALDRMIDAAERIGRAWDFVRVDLYDDPAHPKFGEVTFYPGSGFSPFTPPEANFRLGAHWRIPRGTPGTDGRSADETAAPPAVVAVS
jgi:hypothetical protein